MLIACNDFLITVVPDAVEVSHILRLEQRPKIMARGNSVLL